MRVLLEKGGGKYFCQLVVSCFSRHSQTCIQMGEKKTVVFVQNLVVL